MTTDIIYYVTDLSAEHRRKTLLNDESKEGLIKLISETFKKPLLKILVPEEEKHLVEEKMSQLPLKTFNKEEKYGFGSFLLNIECIGEL